MIRIHDDIMQIISSNHKSTDNHKSTLRDHGMAEPPCSPVRLDHLRDHGMAEPPCSPVRLDYLSEIAEN